MTAPPVAPPIPSPGPIPDRTPALADALAAWLRAHGPVLVAFSGGVDSAFLAAAALRTLGPDGVLAVIGRSASYPAAQWATARALAHTLGLPLLEVDTQELDDPNYAANPSDRCYFCKRELWARLAPLARSRGLTLLDGTNADDLGDWRPGARAGREAGVRSPLAELGFSKADVRAASARLGLPTAAQPSAPCLASRLPYGTPVTPVRALGVAGDLRVRDHGDLARVELPADALDRWLAPDARVRLAAAVRRAGYRRVAVDLRGFRSGSLNVLAGVVPG